MKSIFTNSLKEVFKIAYKKAYLFKHNFIRSDHILLALFLEKKGIAGKILRSILKNSKNNYKKIEEISRNIFNSNDKLRKDLLYTPRVKKILILAKEELQNLGYFKIGTEHILLNILRFDDILAIFILKKLNFDLINLKKMLLKKIKEISISSEILKNNFIKNNEINNKIFFSSNNISVLNSVTIDLTMMAYENKIDPVFGRENEINKIINILSRRTKNNPVLIGEPGIGKTAIVEGIAQKIINNDVPFNLQNKRLLILDMASLVAGTKYRGEFEERFKKLINEVFISGNIILFIDELHTLVGAGGSEGSIDASNILKPSLAKGNFQIIGATTIDEYNKYIECDSALDRRFSILKLEEPSYKDTISILKKLKFKYEEFHNVFITDIAIETAVKLSLRYINYRKLPDKAIDLLDEAAAKVNLKKKKNFLLIGNIRKKICDLKIKREKLIENCDFKKASKVYNIEKEKKKKLNLKIKNLYNKKKKNIVLEDDVIEVLSQWTGIPLQKLKKSDKDRLFNLEKNLHKRIIGQNNAVRAIVSSIKRSRVGLSNPHKPLASFMFLGPTGVGKTELVKALSEIIFDNKNLIRIDMSEYMEKYSISKLIGSAPGYIGYENGGQLTEKVRRNPYSIILFDEIEKAHLDILNILLQILDNGCLTDSKGKEINFKNTIIIMTSNIGVSFINNHINIGFNTNQKYDYSFLKKNIFEELKKNFRSEFLNRIDEIIIFDFLNKLEIYKITRKICNELIFNLKEKKIFLKITNSAIKLISEKSFNFKNGARPIRRFIQKNIESLISDLIISDKILNGNKIIIGTLNKKFYININGKKVRSFTL